MNATPRCAVRVVEGHCPGRLRARIERGVIAAAKLALATDALTESLAEAVCIFQDHFGDDVEALITLDVPDRKNVGLRYSRGNVYVEHRTKNRITASLLIDASREARLAATKRLSALYVACGGVLPKGI